MVGYWLVLSWWVVVCWLFWHCWQPYTFLFKSPCTAGFWQNRPKTDTRPLCMLLTSSPPRTRILESELLTTIALRIYFVGSFEKGADAIHFTERLSGRSVSCLKMTWNF